MAHTIKDQAVAQSAIQKRAEAYRNLIRKEAVIGGTIFGKIPKGHLREFFCLDEHTWVWHEEWIDEQGVKQINMTRYDVRTDGIVKYQDNHSYKAISPTEVKNLRDAARLYYKRVTNELYSQTA